VDLRPFDHEAHADHTDYPPYTSSPERQLRHVAAESTFHVVSPKLKITLVNKNASQPEHGLLIIPVWRPAYQGGTCLAQ
jgi:hypothetical protein